MFFCMYAARTYVYLRDCVRVLPHPHIILKRLQGTIWSRSFISMQHGEHATVEFPEGREHVFYFHYSPVILENAREKQRVIYDNQFMNYLPGRPSWNEPMQCRISWLNAPSSGDIRGVRSNMFGFCLCCFVIHILNAFV